MRKLIGKDAFKMARILKKSGIKNKLDSIEIDTSNYTKVGVNVLMTIIEACSEQGVEDEVFAFLDDVLEINGTSNMDLFELIEHIKLFAKENDLKRFLSVVGSTL